jgi:hypothetical protein
MAVVALSAAVSAALPEIPGVSFAKVTDDTDAPGGSFDQLPRAAQRLYLVLHRLTRFGTEEIRLTTEQLAEHCKRSVRWVYKAIRQLLDHKVGEREAPIIAKRFVKGPREVAGRVLALIVKFKEPRAKAEKKAKAKARAPAAAPAAAPASAPAGPGKPAAPVEDPGGRPSPGFFAKWREAAGPGKPPAPDRPAAPKKSAEEQIAELRRRAEGLASKARDEPGAPGQPSGP